MSSEALPAPALPSLRRLWPVPEDTGGSPRLLAAAVAVGGLATLTIRLDGIGSAVLLAGVGVLAIGVAARPGRRTAAELTALGLTVALLSVTALRDAPWLVALCLLASWPLASLALVPARTWTGVTISSLVAALLPVRVVRWTYRTLAGLPIRGLGSARVWLVSVVTAGLVAVFGALFASADPAYSALIGDLVPDLTLPDVMPRVFLFGAVTTTAVLAAYLGRQPPAPDALAPPPGRAVRRWEWALPLVALDLLFLSFVLVQLTVLFGGRTHVLGTNGLTYAEYARQGFGQLLVVTMLTLAVVAIAVRKAPRLGRADRRLVQGLLAGLCLLALVVVASAIHRMSLYEQAFGFTRLRMLATTIELVLGGVFLLLMVAGIRMSGAWLPRACVALAVSGLLALAAINPDAYIADRNVDRYQSTGHIDLDYLSTLSADAVPALLRLPQQMRGCALSRLTVRLGTTRDPWYDDNAARQHARQLLRASSVPGCGRLSD